MRGVLWGALRAMFRWECLQACSSVAFRLSVCVAGTRGHECLLLPEVFSGAI